MNGIASFRNVCAAFLIVGLFFEPIGVCYGQAETTEEHRLAFSDGLEAIEAGQERRAIDLLEEVVIHSPSYIDAEHGSAAYWLGRALAEEGQMDKARNIWRIGVLTTLARDQSSARLADAFAHQVFLQQDTSNYELATEAYLRMLEQLEAGEGLEAQEDREVVTEHLRYLALILPERIKRQAHLPLEVDAITPERLSAIDGSTLLRWWRSQDPLPATGTNERLREHLQRISFARENYAHPGTKTGLDDRGDIYIRLGSPDETVEVNYDESRLTEQIYSPGGVKVNLSDFPDNEFWSYGSLDRRTYYIFVRNRTQEPFTTGKIEDLLPRKLQSGFTSNERGTDRSMKALSVLRTIYRQYAPFHPEMETRYDEVANYIANYQMEQGEMSNIQYEPEAFIRRTMAETRNLDELANQIREEHTPTQTTSVLDEVSELDVAVRSARFLNEDGTTRTEIYWAPEVDALTLDDEQLEGLENEEYERGNYLVRLTVTQQTPEYIDRIVNQERYLVTDMGGEGVTIPAQTFTTQKGDSTLFHLGMQWDQHAFAPGEEEVGPKLQVAAVQEDSLEALINDERILEMSDLKPMVIPEGESSLEEAIPYPFAEVTPQAALALGFEVYHLPFNVEERTEYTIEYDVYRREDRGALRKLIQGEEEQRTTVSTSREGTKRTAEESILLDLSNWELRPGMDLTITVRVTDEISGQQVERSIDFRTAPSAEE